MKRIVFISTTILMSVCVCAQAPNKMSYQAVIRNNSNTLLANQMVGMRISILKSTASGAPVYVETQSPTTNDNGLATIEIGGGKIVSGTFSTIDWANGPYFVKTETDPTGGTNYTITGTSQLLSVPYALYAQSSGDTSLWRKNGNQLYSLKNVAIGKVNDGLHNLDLSGPFVQIAKDSAGVAGFVKNIPLNQPGYDGSLILGFCAYYSTVELHHEYGGYDGGPNTSNFYTTFNTTEGGVSAGERMRIAPNGNVGIGTKDPQRTLHVNDIIRLEPRKTVPSRPSKGDIYFDGSVWQNCW